MRKDDELPNSLSDPTAPADGDYGWLVRLTRAGWAWEFLRRNPYYRRQYADRSEEATAEELGLRYFEDAVLDARDATAYWLPEWCPAVLPVSAIPLRPDERAGLDTKTLACQTKLRLRAGGADGLFISGGRMLQVELSGAESLDNVALSVPVVQMPEQPAARMLAIRRFCQSDYVGVTATDAVRAGKTCSSSQQSVGSARLLDRQSNLSGYSDPPFRKAAGHQRVE